MRIKQGDTVFVLSGKDRGKQGKATRVLLRKGRVVVEGVNIRKKRMRPRREGAKGETVALAFPIDASNVIVVCPECKRPSRTGRRRVAPGRLVRYCRRCDAALP